MNNNDIIRRIRYTFEFNDAKMIEIFGSAGLEVTRADVSDWLKKDDDPEQKKLNDHKLAYFLNGFIIAKRGKQEGAAPVAEKDLNNNIIFRKLKIALTLQDDDILDILQLVDFRFGKHELSAFFRKPDHDKYRLCKDQVLRNFLYGMQEKYRPNGERD
jgi:uncharacterized protein YehS (DUF1456 family)